MFQRGLSVTDVQAGSFPIVASAYTDDCVPECVPVVVRTGNYYHTFLAMLADT